MHQSRTLIVTIKAFLRRDYKHRAAVDVVWVRAAARMCAITIMLILVRRDNHSYMPPQNVRLLQMHAEYVNGMNESQLKTFVDNMLDVDAKRYRRLTVYKDAMERFRTARKRRVSVAAGIRWRQQR